MKIFIDVGGKLRIKNKDSSFIFIVPVFNSSNMISRFILLSFKPMIEEHLGYPSQVAFFLFTFRVQNKLVNSKSSSLGGTLSEETAISK